VRRNVGGEGGARCGTLPVRIISRVDRKVVLAVFGMICDPPFRAILMAGDLSQRQTGLDEKDKVHATQECDSPRRANIMINDLLDLARCNLGTGISGGRQPLLAVG
jgi:hypothetical protein